MGRSALGLWPGLDAPDRLLPVDCFSLWAGEFCSADGADLAFLGPVDAPQFGRADLVDQRLAATSSWHHLARETPARYSGIRLESPAPAGGLHKRAQRHLTALFNPARRLVPGTRAARLARAKLRTLECVECVAQTRAAHSNLLSRHCRTAGSGNLPESQSGPAGTRFLFLPMATRKRTSQKPAIETRGRLAGYLYRADHRPVRAILAGRGDLQCAPGKSRSLPKH